jgi:putative membrane protein
MATFSTNPSSPSEPVDYAFYKRLMIGLGALVPLLVAVLHYFPGLLRIEGTNVRFLPPLIAVINSLTAVALVAGYAAIRNKNVALHRAMMGTAFGLGALFLLAYVAYHSQAPSTKFGGVGLIRTVYYTLLLTHIGLAIVTVGLVLFTLYFALTQQFARHRRIARWTFPIWLYVSVTGVIVYFMIAPYYPAG